MPKLVDLKARGHQDREYENEALAKTFDDAARRARRGEFKSVCWVAWGRDESAHFGWHKFGSIIPLIGSLHTMMRDMGDSPHMALRPLDDPDDKDPA
jgi:hypothetical protein